MSKVCCQKKGGLKRPETNGNIREFLNNLKAPKMLSNAEKREHVKNQTLNTAKYKHYCQNIEPIDSTMKTFSTITCVGNIPTTKSEIVV